MYIATRGKKSAHLTTEAQADLYRKNGWEVRQEGGGRSPNMDTIADTPTDQMGYDEPRPRGRTR